MDRRIEEIRMKYPEPPPLKEQRPREDRPREFRERRDFGRGDGVENLEIAEVEAAEATAIDAEEAVMAETDAVVWRRLRRRWI